MSLLPLYLLLGLIAHKAVWEVLKRWYRHANDERGAITSRRVSLIKAIKLGILLGLVIQTLGVDVLPMVSEPFLLRMVGVVIYTMGLLMAIVGRIQLSHNWSDIETPQVLLQQNIVSYGIYRYMRHPIYIGDLLLLVGLELSLNSWLVVGAGLMVPIVLLQAIREERMLVHALPGYDTYCTRTKRFIPFVV